MDLLRVGAAGEQPDGNGHEYKLGGVVEHGASILRCQKRLTVRAAIASHTGDIPVYFPHRGDDGAPAAARPVDDVAAVLAKAGAFHLVFRLCAGRMDSL